jgi:hypothetical protein
MPFRDTAFAPDTLGILQTVFNKVCADYSVTDDEERTEAARRMIQTALNGVVDPERLTAAAVVGLRFVRKFSGSG